MFKSTLILLAAASSVAAHGFVSSFKVDGKEYRGSEPNSGNTDTAVRLINSIDPVKGANNPDMKCGFGAVRVDQVADANPGSNIDIAWSNGQWPHNTGPILTYMASCGDQSCKDFDSSNARWFKIDQKGLGDNNQWVQASLMAGASVNVQIPNKLKAGNYLMRHEIIGLHLGEQQGGAEFYPSCLQFKVGGNENGQPADNELVSFPGGYSDNDAGILGSNFYDPGSYSFPGPKISSLVGDAGSPNGGNDNGNNNDEGDNEDEGDNKPSSSSSGNNSKPTDVNNASSNGGSCKLKKKRSAAPVVAAINDTSAQIYARAASGHEYRPRHVSRVMRDIVFPKN